MTKQAEQKWAGERNTLKKVQVHFNFVKSLHRKIHHHAADEDLAPSDLVRKVVGLTYTKVQRPRIGLSFNDADLTYLANRYKMDINDRSSIKKKVMEEITEYFSGE